MKRAATTSLVVLVLLVSGVVQSLSLAIGQAQDIGYVIKMSVTYTNQSTEDKVWNFTERIGDRVISLFMNNSWQTVELEDSTFSIEAQENDTDGNPIAVLQFPVTHLSPGEDITFYSLYQVVSKPRLLPTISEAASGILQDIPEDLSDKYTREEGPWLTGNSTLQSLAHSIAGDETKVLTIVKKIVLWIHNNIAYKIHEVPYYANETLTERRGDCDDQAIVLITLSRILGIPAHLQVGAIYLPSIDDTSTNWEGHVNETSKRIGWHGWAMVYVPPWGWLPVDLTYAQGAAADPLKAVTNAAVTSQSVIQYMNVTGSDYVGSSRRAREFLIANDFYVSMEDVMFLETGPQSPWGEGLTEALIIGVLVAVVILIASSLLVSRRLKKKWVEEEEIPKP